MATFPKYSAPLPEGLETFRDGLGVRCLVTDPTNEDRIERLYLVPELARHGLAVDERTSRLANFRHARFARLRGVEADPDPDSMVVWVNADPVDGIRLFDVLLAAEQGRVVIDVNTALQVAREVLPALNTLHDSRSVTHGALGPERLVLTPQARLTIVDHGLGSALGALRYPRTRLWREFRIGVPPTPGVPQLDARADVAMVAMTVLAALLGRPITLNEFPDHLRELLDQARERPVTGRDRPLSAALRAWFERALPIESRRPLVSALEAQVALEDALKKERSYAPGASALKHFVERLGPLMPATPAQPKPAAGAGPGSASRAAHASEPRPPRPATKRAPKRRTVEEEEAEEIAFLEQELARLAAEEAGQHAQRAADEGPRAEPGAPAAEHAAPPQAPGASGEDESADAIALARLLDDLDESAAEAPTGAPGAVAPSAAAGTSRQAPPADEAFEGPAVTEIISEVPLRLGDAPVVEFSEYGATGAESADVETPAVASQAPEHTGAPGLDGEAVDEPGTSASDVRDIAPVEGDAGVTCAGPVGELAGEAPVAVEAWCLQPPPPGVGLSEPAAADADAIDPGRSAWLLDRDTLWLDFEVMHASRLIAAASVVPAHASLPARRQRTRSRLSAVAATTRRTPLARAVLPLTGVAAPAPPTRRRGTPARRRRPTPAQLPAAVAAPAATLASTAPRRLEQVTAASHPPLRLVAASTAPVIAARGRSAAPALPSAHMHGATALAPLAAAPAQAPGAPLRLVPPVADRAALLDCLRGPAMPALSARTEVRDTALVVADPVCLALTAPRALLERDADTDVGVLDRVEPIAVGAEAEPLDPPAMATPALALVPAVVLPPVEPEVDLDEAPDADVALAVALAAAADVEELAVATAHVLSLVPPTDDALEAIAAHESLATEPPRDGADVVAEPAVAEPQPEGQAPAPADPTPDLLSPATLEGEGRAPDTATDDLTVEPAIEPAVTPTFVPGEGLVLEVDDLDVSGLRVIELERGAEAGDTTPVAGDDPTIDIAELLALISAQQQEAAEADRTPVAETALEQEPNVAPGSATAPDLAVGQPDVDVLAQEALDLASEAVVVEPEPLVDPGTATASDLPAGEPDLAVLAPEALDLASEAVVVEPERVADPGSALAPDLVVGQLDLEVLAPGALDLAPEAFVVAPDPVDDSSVTLPAEDLGVSCVPPPVEAAPQAPPESRTTEQEEAELAALLEALRAVEDAEAAEAARTSAMRAAEVVVAPARAGAHADTGVQGPAGSGHAIESAPAAIGRESDAEVALEPAVLSEPAAAEPAAGEAPIPSLPAARPEPAKRRRSKSRGRRKAAAAQAESAGSHVVPDVVPAASPHIAAAAPPAAPQAAATATAEPATPVAEPAEPLSSPLAQRKALTSARESWSVVAMVPDEGTQGPAGPVHRRAPEVPALHGSVPLAASPAFDESLPSYAPWLAGTPLPAGAAEASPRAIAPAVPVDTEASSVYSPEPTGSAPLAVSPALAPPASLSLPAAVTDTSPAIRVLAPPVVVREATPPPAASRFRGPAAQAEVAAEPAPMFAVPGVDPASRPKWMLIAAAMAVIVAVGAAAFWVFRPARTGSLVVQTSAQGVEVFIGGHSRGIAPVTVELPAGEHVVELRGHGATRTVKVDVKAGRQFTQQVNWSEGRSTGSLKVTSTPPGAKVLIGGELRGVTPVVVEDLAAGAHLVTVQGDSGTVRRNASVVAGEVAEIDVSIFSGWFQVFAPFRVDVRVDGRRVGTSEDGKLLLPAGVHQVELVDATFGIAQRHRVEITPGGTTTLSMEAPTGTIDVDAPAGTQVYVDKELVGTTPLGKPLRVKVGTREVLLSHPELKRMRRETLKVTTTGAARVGL